MTRLIRPSALKRLKDTYRSDEGVLLPHLERHVMRSGFEARPDDHSMHHMHPSDLAKHDWCGRHDYYRITDAPVDRTSQANPSFRMANAFAEGHTIHGKYQTWLWEMGVLWGDWQCLECGHRWGALSPKVCQFCLSPRLVYRELPMRHKNYLVEGHADAAVHLEDWRGLVEIKSIGIQTLRFEAPRLYQQYQDGTPAEEIWFNIKRPLPSHMRQGQYYLWMSFPRYEQICFIYESKFTQQTKEFVVGYNKDYIAARLDDVREVAQGVRTGITPERPSWAEDAQVKICRSCEYRRTCWNIGAPNGNAAQEEVHPPTVVVQRTNAAKRRRTLRPS